MLGYQFEFMFMFEFISFNSQLQIWLKWIFIFYADRNNLYLLFSFFLLISNQGNQNEILFIF